MSKSIRDLDVSMQAKAQTAYEKMNCSEKLRGLGANGGVAVVETRRELVIQMAYYSRGRMPVEDVRKMYEAAGLYVITAEEARVKNTWTLKSKHIDGKAIDLCPVRDGKLWWTAPDVVWLCMGEIGEDCGLTWGGRWPEKDNPHFEL